MLRWWARENHTSKKISGTIRYHETLYSSRVIVALFLPAVLTMCSEALMNLTWMKLVIFWDASFPPGAR